MVSLQCFDVLEIIILGVRLFLGEENVVISNFSMIAAGLFHDKDIDGPGGAVGVTSGADGQNDGLWCQSSLNKSMIGTWYCPNGAEVSRVEASPLYSNNTPIGQIGLLRNGVGNVEGLYSCVIPNEEGVNQTLYVAAYGNGEFDINDGKLILLAYFLFIYLFLIIKSFQSLMNSHSSSSHQLLLILQCLVCHLMSLIDHLV